MLTLKLNNETITLANTPLLKDALTHWGYQDGPYAVAINQIFIPKSRYSMTVLTNNDHIEIVSPMQGG
jgi:sulfur carrier protein